MLLNYEYDLKGNSFSIVEAWYASGFEGADYRGIYSGFNSSDEAIEYAQHRIEEDSPNAKIEVLPGMSGGKYVAANLKGGRLVFTIAPALDVHR